MPSANAFPEDLDVVGRPLVGCPAGGLATRSPVVLRIRAGRVASCSPLDALEPGEIGGCVAMLGDPRAVIVEGLSDSHLHLLAAAAALRGEDWSHDPPRSIRDALDRLAALRGGPDEWLAVTGFEETRCVERRFPLLDELDSAVADRPLRLRHATRHACALNSRGLALLDELARRRGAEAPARLAAARASAAAAEGAAGHVLHGIDRLVTELVGTADDGIGAAIADVSRQLASAGVVAVDEVTGSNGPERVALLAGAVDRGEILQRVRVFVPDAELAPAAREAAGGRFEIAGVKLFAHDAGAPSGGPFRAALDRARCAGLPVAVHAVEPDVVAAVVEALEAAPPRAPGGPRGRDRIEHASLCPPELAERIARARLAVVTQPGFVFARGAKYLGDVEPPLHDWLYPLRGLLDAGVLLAAGSDAPVGPLDPRVALEAAVSRRTAEGAVLGPSQRIRAWDALDLYAGAARRVRDEAPRAPWAADAPADLAILEAGADPAARGFVDLRALAIVVGGRLRSLRGDA